MDVFFKFLFLFFHRPLPTQIASLQSMHHINLGQEFFFVVAVPLSSRLRQTSRQSVLLVVLVLLLVLLAAVIVVVLQGGYWQTVPQSSRLQLSACHFQRKQRSFLTRLQPFGQAIPLLPSPSHVPLQLRQYSWTHSHHTIVGHRSLVSEKRKKNKQNRIRKMYTDYPNATKQQQQQQQQQQ